MTYDLPKRAAQPRDAAVQGTLQADFGVLRVPLLSLDTFLDWSGQAQASAACDADDDILDQALERDRTLLRSRLKNLVNDDHVAAAIELASPDLHEGMRHWHADPRSKAGRSIERSLVRYVTRMTSRPTPFGLFCGYALAEVTGPPMLRLGSRDDLRTVTLIDSGLLQALVQEAGVAARAHPELLLRRNPLLYRIGMRFRVPVRAQRSNRPRLIALAATPMIEAVLDAADAEVMAGDLLTVMANRGASAQESRDLLDRLIDRELLIPARQFTVTGEKPAVQAVAALRATPGASGSAEVIEAAARELHVTLGDGQSALAAAKRRLGELGGGVLPRRCVQVDTIRSGDIVVPKLVIDDLRRSAELLAKLAPERSDELGSFRIAFENRFGTRPVPLLEALDPDFGIRLGNDVPQRTAADMERDARRGRRLLRLMARGHGTARGEVELTPADIADLVSDDTPRLARSFAVICSLVARDAGSLGQGEFALMTPLISAPGGARLVGRFCHGDEVLTKRVRRHLMLEAAAEPETIFAEIAAAPDLDWGLNVTHRPVLREWEIECGGFSGAAPDRRLDPADLLVSVEAGQVMLSSRRLGRRVRPRSATAMNPQWLALPAARFLMLLADQEWAVRGWSWGDLQDAPALPRIKWGRVILTPRRWNVLADELAQIKAGTDAAGFRRLQRWRRDRGVPRYVTFDDRKGALLIDLSNVMSVDAFLAAARDSEIVRLTEAPVAGGSPVRGPDGQYAHELLVAFTTRATPATGRARPALPASVAERRRRFEPGSEWLFAKLYGPASAADRVLTSRVAPLRAELKRRGLIDRWFFIRYADPDRHLRVRFHGVPGDLMREVMPALQEAVAPALADGDLYRICIDTYEREVERYGGIAGVELMERAAEADSDATLEALQGGLEGVERRHLTVASLALFYADSGLDLSGRRECCDALRTAWSRGFDRSHDALLRAGQRAERARLEEVLNSLDRPDGPAAIRAIARRSARLHPVLAELSKLADDGSLDRPYADVLGSLAHMFVNRLLRDGGGLDELRVHDALARVYASQLARDRSKIGNLPAEEA